MKILLNNKRKTMEKGQRLQLNKHQTVTEQCEDKVQNTSKEKQTVAFGCIYHPGFEENQWEKTSKLVVLQLVSCFPHILAKMSVLLNVWGPDTILEQLTGIKAVDLPLLPTEISARS